LQVFRKLSANKRNPPAAPQQAFYDFIINARLAVILSAIVTD
jgi:hypothetical protein